MRPELAFTYDADMQPIAAKCTACGKAMPTPSANLHSVADILAWFSRYFLEHKYLEHTLPSARNTADSDPTQ